jgi:hypothetical protein
LGGVPNSQRTKGEYESESPFRIPTIWMWFVPFLLVIAYITVVTQFFHSQAHWTGDRFIRVTILLFLTAGAFSALWFAAAYGASLLFGEFVAFGLLKLIARIPGLHRHVIVTPPKRQDTAREVWGRFGILLLIALGFELIFMVLLVKRGDLAPYLAIDAPFRFFTYELLAGIGLALLLAPAAPFLASRLRTRITDTLEFPYLWLALLLLIVGGASILVVEVLPGVVFDPALFFTSILMYAPAAWYVSLAFSRAEVRARQQFLDRAWKTRGGRFHFGRIRVVDEPEGTIIEV